MSSALKKPALSTLSEIRDIFSHVPPLRKGASFTDRDMKDHALGKIAHHLATVMARGIRHPRIGIFAPAQSEEMSLIYSGNHPLHGLCKALDADLRVYELTPENSDSQISDSECAQAIAYGMMVVEAGVDCLGVMTLSKEADKAAQFILNHRKDQDPLDILRQSGSLELAAMTGGVLAARFGLMPVVMVGDSGSAITHILGGYDQTLIRHCVLADGEASDSPLIPYLKETQGYGILGVPAGLSLIKLASGLLKGGSV